MILELIKKIDSLQSFDTKTIMETFSLEERKLIVCDLGYMFPRHVESKISRFVDRLQREGVCLLTDEEIREIRNTNTELFFFKEEDLFRQCSEEKKLEILKRIIHPLGRPLFRYLGKDESYLKLVDLYVKGELPEGYRDCIVEIICAARSDECKLQCVKKLAFLPRKQRLRDGDKVTIASTLSSDEAKLKMLKGTKNNTKCLIVSFIDSDEIKAKYINLLAVNKGIIIQHLKDDKLKEYYFKKYYKMLSAKSRAEIIASFKDENLIKKYIPLIHGLIAMDAFLRICRNEDMIYELSKNTTLDKYLVGFLRYVKKDEYKLQIARRIKNVRVLFERHDFTHILFELDLPTLYYMIAPLSEDEKEEFVSKAPYPRQLMLLPYIKDFEKAEQILGHIDDFIIKRFGYVQEIDSTIEYFAKNLNINAERLRRLVKATNPTVIKYLKNKNIKEALNLSDEDFDKYLEIIKVENRRLDKNSFNDVIHAILNRRYAYERREDIEIFSSFQIAIDNQDKAKINQLLDKISTLIDVDSKIPNRQEFIKKLIERDTKAIDYLHEITQEYIRISKDNYIKEKTIEYHKILAPTKIERGDYIKIIISSLEAEEIIDLLKTIKPRVEENDLKELIDNEELLKELIEYKKDPQAYGPPNDTMKKYLKRFNVLLNYVYKYRSLRLGKDNPIADYVKTTEEAPVSMVDDIVFAIMGLDTAELRDTVFCDDNLYKELLNFIHNYKIFGWTPELMSFANSSGFPIDNITFIDLISNFAAIKNIIDEKVAKGELPRATFSHLVDLAVCYEESSTIYQYIFGKDIYTALKNNSGPNSAYMATVERIDKALELLGPLRARDSITTPPIDQDYSLSSGKSLHVRLGHVNSLHNLIYGEETGACMRIGGVGESLFEFCLLNKNGFHIEISDPKTGEFVSRVSGFRNGNTVFLNQLRFSKIPFYDNNDLIELIKKVAQDIIKLSKSSSYPIDNVVISNTYVFGKSVERVTDLGVQKLYKGYDPIYLDVSRHAIVLATSSKDKRFVPLSLGAKRLPEYEPLRDKVRVYLKPVATIKINEMLALDEYLGGKPIEEIEPIEDLGVAACYVGEDWYISITDDGKVNTYIMKSSRNKEKAEQEIKKTLEVLKKSSEKRVASMQQGEDNEDGSSMHM